MKQNNLSIIIPALDEEENINELLSQIEESFSEIANLEIVIVDDGSKNELKNYLDISKFSFKVQVLRNNYTKGQSASIEFGLKNCSGNVIGLIDGDLQNPPSELRRLYKYYCENNLDAVISFRKNRNDEFMRKLISLLANWMLKVLTKSKYKDLGSSLKIVRRDCLESLSFRGDLHRFITPMLHVRGYKIFQLEVEHKKRIRGESKYGFSRIIPVLVDGLLFYLTKGFTKNSKYAIGQLSFILFITSVLLNLVVLYQKLIYSEYVHRNPLFIVAMVFLILSIQIFSQVVQSDNS